MVVTIENTVEGEDRAPVVPCIILYPFAGCHKPCVDDDVGLQTEIGTLVACQLTARKNLDTVGAAVRRNECTSVVVKIRICVHAGLEVQQFLFTLNQERMSFCTVLHGLRFCKGEERDQNHCCQCNRFHKCFHFTGFFHVYFIHVFILSIYKKQKAGFSSWKKIQPS